MYAETDIYDLLQLTPAEEDVRALVTDQERQVRLLGNELYETILSRTRQEWEKARGMLDQLQAQASEPDMSAAITVLQERRARGAAAAWEVAETHERRELLRLVVRAIRLAPTEGRFCHAKEAEIEWQPWVVRAGYAIPASKEWLPIRARTPRPNTCI